MRLPPLPFSNHFGHHHHNHHHHRHHHFLSSSSSLLLLLLITELIFLELLLELPEPIAGQRRTNPNRRRPSPARRRRPLNRNRKPGTGEPERINCYTCFADFEKIPLTIFNPSNFIINNACYNPAVNYTLADAEYLTRCSATTRYCLVDVTRMNNVLLSVDRRCGERNQCRKTCLDRGYGLIKETCTFCCAGRVTEDDPGYDEELHANYTCRTDW